MATGTNPNGEIIDEVKFEVHSWVPFENGCASMRIHLDGSKECTPSKSEITSIDEIFDDLAENSAKIDDLINQLKKISGIHGSLGIPNNLDEANKAMDQILDLLKEITDPKNLRRSNAGAPGDIMDEKILCMLLRRNMNSRTEDSNR